MLYLEFKEDRRHTVAWLPWKLLESAEDWPSWRACHSTSWYGWRTEKPSLRGGCHGVFPSYFNIKDKGTTKRLCDWHLILRGDNGGSRAKHVDLVDQHSSCSLRTDQTRQPVDDDGCAPLSPTKLDGARLMLFNSASLVRWRLCLE